jgi:hypothetical protein
MNGKTLASSEPMGHNQMHRLIGVTFRGKDVDVVIDHDFGYESDTGTHPIDWHFADPWKYLNDFAIDAV